MNGFDFGLTSDGEIIIDKDHNIQKTKGNELKIQLSQNRIKSISNDWFVDNIGANLEELIGMPCNEKTAEIGREKIINELTFDELFDEKETLIQIEIKEKKFIIYYIYLKLYQKETEEEYSEQIIVELDLVKGVKIRYGWEPRRV